MAGGRVARARAGGGVGIQALRQGEARVAAGIAAVAVAAVLALSVFAAAGEEATAAGLLGAAGAAVLAVGLLTRRGAPVTAGIALLGTAYAVTVVGDDLDGAAALVAAGLVLVAELGYWAIEPGAAVKLGRSAMLRRTAAVGVLTVASGVVGALLLAAGSTPFEGEAVFGVLGVVAMLLIAGASVWLLQGLRSE